MFGHQGGTFTGARREGTQGRIREACGGTLFLDEIGDMPLSLQARLLRVLQDREVLPLGGGKSVAVDFALVCATHRQLRQEMQAGRFREDLYYRLNGLTLQLPALRERSDSDYLLVQQLSSLVSKRSIAIAPELLESLRRYRRPVNVRQLANALRTASALIDDHEAVIDWRHLPDDLTQALQRKDSFGNAADTVARVNPRSDPRSLSHQTIARAVSACAGNLAEAARSLGIIRNTLYRKLRKMKGAKWIKLILVVRTGPKLP